MATDSTPTTRPKQCWHLTRAHFCHFGAPSFNPEPAATANQRACAVAVGSELNDPRPTTAARWRTRSIVEKICKPLCRMVQSMYGLPYPPGAVSELETE